MASDSYFTGISGIFWSLTYALIALILVVASVGGDGLVKALLAVTAAYAILGIAYGA